MNNFKKIISTVAIGVLFLLVCLSSASSSETLGGQGGRSASACTIFATSTVGIGNQASTQITTTYSNNAYVIIQQPVHATNTVALNFNADATLTSGFQLAPGSASSTPDTLIFGRNTDFPFDGYVTAITNTGSTTLFITECRY